MVILSANPYEIPKEELAGIKVEKLILAGKDYHSAKRSVIKAVISGLTNGSTSY